MKKKNKRFFAFTLVELMVTVIIVGILAALAIPNYINTREKVMDKEAISILKLVRAAEKQYLVKFLGYWPSGTVNTLAQINGNLSLDLSGSNWAYAVTGTGSAFSANASRSGRAWIINSTISNPVCSGTCF
jgi:prepilin-type N-terminal cleavage/methylation domain-containing protein